MQINFVNYCILCRFYLSSISCIALLLLHKLVCRAQLLYSYVSILGSSDGWPHKCKVFTITQRSSGYVNVIISDQPTPALASTNTIGHLSGWHCSIVRCRHVIIANSVEPSRCVTCFHVSLAPALGSSAVCR